MATKSKPTQPQQQSVRPVSIYAKTDFVGRLEVLAKEERRSLSQMAEILIDEAMAARKSAK